MRAPEGTHGDERGIFSQCSGYGMDLGCFQTFLKGQRRQNAGQAAGHHGLPASGRPDHQDVVAACRCHFQGTLYAFLSFHVGKVRAGCFLSAGKYLPDVRMRDRQVFFSVEEADHLADVVSSIYVNAFHHGGFAGVPAGKDQSFQPLAACGQRNGQGTADGLQTSVEPELSRQHQVRKSVAADSAGCSQNAGGQRKVVGRSFLADIGRSHIDHQLAGGKRVTVYLEG